MRPMILSLIGAQLFLLSACANRHKIQGIENLCLRQLSQAETLYRAKGQDSSNQDTDLANNLITGAKISRAHHEFTQCINKSARASKLLDPNVELVVQVQN